MIDIIIVYAKQVYHQITVYKLHRGKLAFLDPNNKKYTFKVRPFGQMSAPGFYTCIMEILRLEWHAVSLETVRKRRVIGSMAVRVTDAYEIYLNGIKTCSKSKGFVLT